MQQPGSHQHWYLSTLIATKPSDSHKGDQASSATYLHRRSPSWQREFPGHRWKHFLFLSFLPGALVLSRWLFFIVVVLTQLHRDLSYSFGCIRDLLTVFSWFSVRIVPHVDIFLMCLSGEMSSVSFYSTILISSTSFCFYRSIWFVSFSVYVASPNFIINIVSKSIPLIWLQILG